MLNLTNAYKESCPSQCNCEEHLSRVRCANLSLTSQPLNLPSGVQHLKLQGRNFEKILNGIFSENNQIQTLDLSNNNLYTIDRNVLGHLNQLDTLYLQDNKLNTSAIEKLQLAPSIRIINLENNRLHGEIYPPASWDSLHKLHLQFNSITNLSLSFFHGCSKLQEMNASHNSIEALQKPIQDLDTVMHDLSTLDLSWNYITVIDSDYFRMFPNLTHLFLQGNSINALENIGLLHLSHLNYLDLSYNLFQIVPAFVFSGNTELVQLHLTFLHNLTTINPASFYGLSNLQVLALNHNNKLSHLHIYSFQLLQHLKLLHLGNNAFKTLHRGIFANLSSVEEIRLQDNPWSCDCNLKWLIEQEENHYLSAINTNDLICATPGNFTGQYFKDIPTANLPCKQPTIGHYSATRYFPISKAAVLNCQADGDPMPVTIWEMPTGKKKYHHQGFISLDELQPNDVKYHQNHPWHQYKEYPDDHHKKHKERVHILQNGSLYFDFVMRHDAGYYTCIAQNELGNASVTISFRLDFRIIPIRTKESMLFGLATSGSVFIVAVVVGLIRYAVQLCAQRVHKQKRRTIREIIKSLEAYRIAKIDQISAYKTEKMDKISAYKTEKIDKISAYKTEKLGKLSAYRSAKVDQLKQAKENTVSSLTNYLKSTREHYNQQMNGIKDNCSEQLHKLRDNYSQRISRLKDYKSHQVEKIRDNYHAQVNKIKEYGSTQMEKLREQYKTQQQHVFKLLELMNLGNCRGAVEAEISSDTILFEPVDITIDMDPCASSTTDHFEENVSYAGSEDYMTASSSSETSSQDATNEPIKLDVKLETHYTVSEPTDASVEENVQPSDPPNLDTDEGTSLMPLDNVPKGRKSSHEQSSPDYEISIISTTGSDSTTVAVDNIPRESSV